MLHGEIKVNDVQVGQWSAARKETIFTGMHRYDCFAEYYNLEGYPKRTEFTITHYEKMGALVLAANVLRNAISRMR